MSEMFFSYAILSKNRNCILCSGLRAKTKPIKFFDALVSFIKGKVMK